MQAVMNTEQLTQLGKISPRCNRLAPGTMSDNFLCAGAAVRLRVGAASGCAGGRLPGRAGRRDRSGARGGQRRADR